MNILIVADDLFVKGSVNTILVNEILSNIDDSNINFIYYGDNAGKSDSNIIEINDKRFYLTKSILKSNKKKLIKLWQILRHPSLYTLIFKYKLDFDKFISKIYTKEIKKIVIEKKIDKIVAITAPFYTMISVNYFTEIPHFYYKLDPFSTHYTKKDSGLFQFESELDDTACKIFVTQEIYNDYLENSILLKNVDKLVKMNYPINFNKQVNFFKTDKIKLFYIGTVYKDIRNPDYLLKLLDNLDYTCHNFELIFAGSFAGYSDKEIDYIINKPYINYLGIIEKSELINMYNQVDFLVSLGNTIMNQVPSKTFEYIGIRKPIIHIAKNHNCPVIKYLSKYPCKLIIYETDTVSNSVFNLKKFLQQHLYESVSLEELNQNYFDFSNNYLSNLLNKNLCESED